VSETANCGRKGKSEIDKVSRQDENADTQGCASISSLTGRQVHHRWKFTDYLVAGNFEVSYRGVSADGRLMNTRLGILSIMSLEIDKVLLPERKTIKALLAPCLKNY